MRSFAPSNHHKTTKRHTSWVLLYAYSSTLWKQYGRAVDGHFVSADLMYPALSRELKLCRSVLLLGWDSPRPSGDLGSNLSL